MGPLRVLTTGPGLVLMVLAVALGKKIASNHQNMQLICQKIGQLYLLTTVGNSTFSLNVSIDILSSTGTHLLDESFSFHAVFF